MRNIHKSVPPRATRVEDGHQDGPPDWIRFLQGVRIKMQFLHSQFPQIKEREKSRFFLLREGKKREKKIEIKILFQLSLFLSFFFFLSPFFVLAAREENATRPVETTCVLYFTKKKERRAREKIPVPPLSS